MPDNKLINDQKDKHKVDANDAGEVEYVHQQFPHLQHQQVLEAIIQYGPDRDDVMEYLKTFVNEA